MVSKDMIKLGTMLKLKPHKIMDGEGFVVPLSSELEVHKC